MKGIILFCLIILFFVGTTLCAKRDVCIIGAGASGMSASVFLKDKGYDVLVIEKKEVVGGHCSTTYFNPPKFGDRNWLDTGVVVFPDTEFENASGIGVWTLGSRSFAQRFLSEGSTITYHADLPNYGFDFIHNITTGRIPNPHPTPEYIEAFIRFETLILKKYPWLDNINFPDPIPEELLVPFGEFIKENNFQILGKFFFALLYYGGMGNYHNVTTLYAMQNLRVGITKIYSEIGAGFAIKGGCYKIYEGISKYIGKENIILNANVLTVQRKSENNIYIGVDVLGKFQKIECSNIIVTVPHLLENLGFIDLTQQEKDIFSKVIANYYYRFELDVTGPITSEPFNVASIDVMAPDHIPPFPNILAIRREMPFGPACCFAYADTDLTDAQMLHIVNDYLSRLPSTYFTSFTIKNFERHFYQTHFSTDLLSHSPTPYTKLDNLQGTKNTYWAGALFSFAESASVWQKTHDLIEKFFPSKHL